MQSKTGALDVCLGPYVLHNSLISHIEAVKTANGVDEPRLYRIWPVALGDVISVIVWYTQMAYTIAAVVMAFYLGNVPRTVNSVVLSLLIVVCILTIYIISKNQKNIRRMWYVCKADTSFPPSRQVCLTADVLQAFPHVTGRQRQNILQHICSSKEQNATLLLTSRSYWRRNVLIPIVVHVFLGLLCLVAIIVQLETFEIG
ncbi:hypothetical protein ScPMuIL_000889 [Solemya velum]